LAHQAVSQIATFELQRWHALVKLLSAPPSAGLLMIDALFQAGVPRNQITTYGFSRLQNLSSGAEDINHYRDNAPPLITAAQLRYCEYCPPIYTGKLTRRSGLSEV